MINIKTQAAEHIKEILKRSSDTHNTYTPLELCDEMLDKIPNLNSEIDILVMFNLEFLWLLREKFGKENLGKIWFLTPDEMKKNAAAGIGINENQIVIYDYNIKQIIGEENMPKFDVVVGNPPYLRDMHLKMLKMSVNLLSEEGEIIWIHPARWLQDPTALFKGNRSDFNKYKDLPFENLYTIPRIKAQEIFGNRMPIDLVISKLKKGHPSILNEKKIYELRGIPYSLKKLLINTKSIVDVAESNERNGIRVRIKNIAPDSGGIDVALDNLNYCKTDKIIINGKIGNVDWTDFYSKNQYSKVQGSPIPLSISFNSLSEAQNFIDSMNTNIFLFIIYMTTVNSHIQLNYFPFMADYTKPVTDENFKKYYNLSEDEMHFINKKIEELKK